MLQAPDGRWYWYGESKKTPHLGDHGVNCYSAPDISGPWRNEGQVLHQANITVAGQSGPYIIERPKVGDEIVLPVHRFFRAHAFGPPVARRRPNPRF